MLFHPSRLVFLWLPLSLGVAALASPGCNSTVTTTGSAATTTSTGAGTGGTRSGTGGAGGSPAGCPTDTPQSGQACTALAGSCHYPVMCCGDTIASCSSGQWQVVEGPCVGKTPAPTCPTEEPAAGSPCSQGCLGETCSYGSCPDGPGAQFIAQCVGNAWTLTQACTPGGGGGNGGLPVGAACIMPGDPGDCAAGLACCYPCGVPGCENKCVAACGPNDRGCNGGCIALP